MYRGNGQEPPKKMLEGPRFDRNRCPRILKWNCNGLELGHNTDGNLLVNAEDNHSQIPLYRNIDNMICKNSLWTANHLGKVVVHRGSQIHLNFERK